MAARSPFDGRNSLWKSSLNEFFLDSPANRYLLGNIKRNWPFLKKMIQGEVPESPVAAEILISSSCNLKCPHCRGGQRQEITYKNGNQHTINSEDMREIVGQLVRKGVKYIHYSGIVGDPLCAEGKGKTKECIDYVLACAPQVRQGLVTNGIGIDESLADSLIHINQLNVSFDVTNPEDYEKYKGRDMFDKVISNLEMLMEKKKKNNGKVKVRISFLFGSYPIAMRKLEDIVANFTHFLDLDQIIFKFEFGRQIRNFSVCPKAFRYFYDNLEQIKEKIESLNESSTSVVIVDTYEQALSNLKSGIKPKYSTCYFSLFQSTVSSSGMLIPCCHTELNDNLAPVGDLKGDNSFSDIWQGASNWMNDINPKKHCKYCFRVADRFNQFMELMVSFAKHDEFLNWFEENYVHADFKISDGANNEEKRNSYFFGPEWEDARWFAFDVLDLMKSSA